MKIIDKYNLFFGKLHAVYLLIPVMVLAVGVLMYSLITQKPTYIRVRVKGSAGNWWWITPRPPDWLASSIKVGDKELNTVGKEIAVVENVEIFESGATNRDIFVTTKIKVSYNKRTGKYRFKGEIVDVGSPISLQVGNTLFPGLVTKILDDQSSAQRTYIEKMVTTRMYDRWPWEYDSIIIGEQMKVEGGEAIAEVLSKEKRPAEKEVVTDEGIILRAFSPMKEDFFVKFRIKVEPRDNDFVFRDEEIVKIGRQLWITTPSHDYFGIPIIEIADVQ